MKHPGAWLYSPSRREMKKTIRKGTIKNETRKIVKKCVFSQRERERENIPKCESKQFSAVFQKKQSSVYPCEYGISSSTSTLELEQLMLFLNRPL